MKSFCLDVSGERKYDSVTIHCVGCISSPRRLRVFPKGVYFDPFLSLFFFGMISCPKQTKKQKKWLKSFREEAWRES